MSIWHERHERLWVRRGEGEDRNFDDAIWYDFPDLGPEGERFFKYSSSDTVPLKDEILDWFLENTKSAKISMNVFRGSASVYFFDPNEAVLFHLRWT